MANIMYLCFSVREGGWIRYFWIYRFVMFYIALCAVAIFVWSDIDAPFIPDPAERRLIIAESTLGQIVFWYTIIASLIWPIVLWWLVKQGAIDKDVFNLKKKMTSASPCSSARDIIGYLETQKYLQLQQLLRFGFKVTDSYRDYRVK